MAATDFVTETQVDSLVTNIATAVKSNTTAIGTKTDDTTVNAHVADATAAHAASAVSVADVGLLYTAGDAEGAFAEVMGVANAKTDDTTVNAHVANATAAHAASAVSFADTGNKYSVGATNVELALDEVRGIADSAAGGGVAINDAVTTLTDAWSSQKITDYTAASVASLVDTAPAALDTLNELAAAIGDDANFASTMTTALSLRVRVDAAQAFTAPQQAQGKSNLGIVASTVNFAANFNTAIA